MKHPTTLSLAIHIYTTDRTINNNEERVCARIVAESVLRRFKGQFGVDPEREEKFVAVKLTRTHSHGTRTYQQTRLLYSKLIFQ